jgi:general secretion pathway protein D
MMVRRAQSIARLAGCALLAAVVAGCAPPRIPDSGSPPASADSSAPSDPQAHRAGSDNADIPAPVTGAPKLPPPEPPAPTERYDVVVNEVPVSELLFALARDADLEIDIIGDIEGQVTLNATDATLPRLLERIALQAPIRYELRDDYLKIAADEPYVASYPVDYVNITRTSTSSVDTATQIASTGTGQQGGGGGSGGSNNSSTELVNESNNQFWSTLERNLANLLGVSTEGESSGDRIMLNREAGYVSVRATERQHRQVQAYLDQVVSSARRQVLIEATVVEVELSDRHQSGVDWARLAQGDGFDLVQNMTGSALGGAFNVPNPPSGGTSGATIGYTNNTSSATIQSTIKALNEFGNARVVSSPKITALNNQLAILKVVDNRVYFTVEVNETITDNNTSTTFETEVNTVPVGLVMTVTPYIGESEEVLLNVRPTVSSILGFKNDPNPELAQAGVQNQIPEIQVREMESMLRVNSGQTAVIGGLMQNSVNRTERSVPVLGSLPLLGGLFSFRDDQVEKTELIIFLRPTVVDEASVAGDYREFRQQLPRKSGGGRMPQTPWGAQ